MSFWFRCAIADCVTTASPPPQSDGGENNNAKRRRTNDERTTAVAKKEVLASAVIQFRQSMVHSTRVDTGCLNSCSDSVVTACAAEKTACAPSPPRKPVGRELPTEADARRTRAPTRTGRRLADLASRTFSNAELRVCQTIIVVEARLRSSHRPDSPSCPSCPSCLAPCKWPRSQTVRAVPASTCVAASI